MADLGHELTDKELKKLEKRMRDEYYIAQRDTRKKLQEYLEQMEEGRKKQKALLDAGKITKQEYKDWCYRHAMVGQRWKDMLTTLAEDYHHTNEIALAIARQGMPDIFALNMNYATWDLEHKGKIDTGFTLYNHDTAAYLLKDQRQLMPGPSTKKQKEIAANKDMQWNMQKIQSAVLQGVLQGESPYDVAKRLQQVADMDYRASVRYARTMTTSAQNAGRYEAFRRAKRLGVDLTIEWQATLDGRTRHEHRMMHGQRTDVDKPFHTPDGYTIYYPADCTGTSTAPQSEIWNCRCTLLSWVKGFEGDTVKSSPKMEGKSFEEWQNEKNPSFTATKNPVTINPYLANKDNIIQNALEFSPWEHETRNFDQNVFDNLPYEAQNGLTRYTGSSYRRMNSALRGKNRYGEPVLSDERTEDLIQGAEQAISAFKLKDDTILFRGIGDVSTFADMVGLSESELIAAANDGTLVGMRYCEKGFVSTGVRRASGWSKPVFAEAVVPEGFNGVYVDLISENAGERELLLQHHTWFEIQEASYDSMRDRLSMKVFAYDQTPESYVVERKATEEKMRKLGLI